MLAVAHCSGPSFCLAGGFPRRSPSPVHSAPAFSIGHLADKDTWTSDCWYLLEPCGAGSNCPPCLLCLLGTGLGRLQMEPDPCEPGSSMTAVAAPASPRADERCRVPGQPPPADLYLHMAQPNVSCEHSGWWVTNLPRCGLSLWLPIPGVKVNGNPEKEATSVCAKQFPCVFVSIEMNMTEVGSAWVCFPRWWAALRPPASDLRTRTWGLDKISWWECLCNFTRPFSRWRLGWAGSQCGSSSSRSLAQVLWGLTGPSGQGEQCRNYRRGNSIRKEACEGASAVADSLDLSFQIHFFGTVTLCGCAALHLWPDMGASSYLLVIIIPPGSLAVWVPQAS